MTVRRVLPTLLLLSIVIRVEAALVLGNGVESLPGIADQGSYDMLARQLLAGKGFTVVADWWPLTRAGEPIAHW